ncbi:hypothetical protein [Actinomadura latina]|uniref:hypothetical protein n=1 Tax=Actinomadura latina TaxID=163603 RepID=UPI00082D7106|nr:hypothetical protein [Actinomadura latina]
MLRKNAHSPSFFALQRASSGRRDLVDFCIPCNPYFPTPGMFSQLAGSLEDILKYYPSDADTLTAELCSALGHNPQTVVMGNGSTELITWIDQLLVRECGNKLGSTSQFLRLVVRPQADVQRLLIGLGSYLYGAAAESPPDNVVSPGHGWGEPAGHGAEPDAAGRLTDPLHSGSRTEDFRAAI